jgi:hypothetical protein
MAEKTDDLIISISTDLATVRRSLKRLEADISASTSGIQKKFDGLGMGIDKSMTSAMQTRIDKMVGIGTKSTKEWTGALAEQGKEMERLRSRYSPMFAAINSYKTSVTDIRRAHSLGAISADEMTAAIQRERQATLASIAAIKQRNTAIASTAPMGAGSFSTANIAAQFQDIGVTTAMGMSPIQIALQQGTQLSAVLEQLKADGKSTGSALMTAFQSIISPMSLVTIGAIAAGAALVQYIMSASSDLPSVDDILQEHERNIERLGPAYKEALEEQKRYVRDTPALAAARAADTAATAIEKRIADTKAALADIESEIFSEQSGSGTMILTSRFDGARQAIADLAASARAGSPDVRAFQIEIARLEEVGAITEGVARELRSFTQAALDTEGSLAGIRGEVDSYATAMQSVADKMAGVKSTEAREEIQALADRMELGELNTNQLAAAIDELSGKYPDMSATIGELGRVIEQANRARMAIGTVSLADGLAGRYSSDTARKGGRVGESTAEENAAWLRERRDALQQDMDFFLQWDQDIRDKLEAQGAAMETAATRRERQGRGPRESTRRDAEDRFTADLQQIRDRATALREEIAMVGLSEEAQIRRRVALDLEQQTLANLREEARRKGETDQASIKLSDEKIAAIQAEADAYARTAEELRLVQESEDLRRDLAKGFVSDMLSGASAADALTNALKKVGDALINDVLDSVLQLRSAGGGGGGWISNILGLLGGGGGFQTNTTLGALIGAVPGRRLGGPVRAGQPYVVGEKQPELFVPSTSGTIVPQVGSLASGSGGAVSAPVTITIDARGADREGLERVERQLGRLQAELPARITQTVQKMPKSRQKV